MIALDLIGQRFGRLSVLGRSDRRPRAWWTCRCDCGKAAEVSGNQLRQGKTTSCGCARRDGSRTTHGHGRAGKHTRTYRSWAAMLSRCRNPRHAKWPLYGGRGIEVCARWESFENFLADMGERPKGRTIDRRNNDGHYESDNCRWATPKQQAANRAKRGTRQCAPT